jgi:hypothetical protein
MGIATQEELLMKPHDGLFYQSLWKRLNFN